MANHYLICLEGKRQRMPDRNRLFVIAQIGSMFGLRDAIVGYYFAAELRELDTIPWGFFFRTFSVPTKAEREHKKGIRMPPAARIDSANSSYLAAAYT